MNKCKKKYMKDNILKQVWKKNRATNNPLENLEYFLEFASAEENSCSKIYISACFQDININVKRFELCLTLIPKTY